MIEIARVDRASRFAPAAYFDRWVALDTHPEWSTSMEFLRLDGPVTVGASGTLKSVNGDPAEFYIDEIVPGSIYADTTLLHGATLTVRHEVRPSAAGGSDIRITAILAGPIEGEWAEKMGDSVQNDIAADLDGLTALLEREASAN